MKTTIRMLSIILLLIFTSAVGAETSVAVSYVDSQCDTQMTVSQKRVSDIYVAYYGRPANVGGLNFWTDRLNENGGKLGSIIKAFGNSPEFTKRFGNLSNNELVDNIYFQLFGRTAAAGGREFYVGKLDSGDTTLTSVALAVMRAASGSDLRIINNKSKVAAHYFNSSSQRAQALSSSVLLDILTDITPNSRSAGDACGEITTYFDEGYCISKGVAVPAGTFPVYSRPSAFGSCVNYATTAICSFNGDYRNGGDIFDMPRGSYLECESGDEGSLPTDSLIRIPIIFHVYQNSDREWNEEWVTQMIEQANSIFRNTLINSQPDDQRTTDSYIEFYAAERRPDGSLLPVPGVDEINEDARGLDDEGQLDYGQWRTQALQYQWNARHYINVNVARYGGGAYSDMIFINDYLAHNLVKLGGLLAHELGHLLSLGHPFFTSVDKSCGANDPDGLDDTPRYNILDYTDDRNNRIAGSVVRTYNTCDGQLYYDVNPMGYMHHQAKGFTIDQVSKMRQWVVSYFF